ncbi:MAG: glutathione S-transferase family protein [Acinetobacter populi]|jgi:glutathione S-transferase|uniref:glutathione S-transferase family protein n=1 Tax=Acinetobacter populi TaxID=1582270 RepID=UPI002357908B|nr:glutathione S-transferase family protein [Acinetobacter populi]MCH4248671.1 glutathione S-transferase family protein [Acinetobacter populi]
MRILYQFPLSLFCEKARWLLDHKELDYIAQNLAPGLHRIMIHYRTGQYQLPVLKDGNNWIADSSQIALYLDSKYPELTLIRKEPDLRESILSIDSLTQELGIHVRRWLFHYILQNNNKAALDIIIGEKGMMRDFEKVSIPAMKMAIKKFHNINDTSVQESKLCLDQLTADLNQTLIENGGRYLVGERLTLADIAVCSMLAPVLMIVGTPWEMTNPDNISEEVLSLQQALLALPLGQYVQRIYETERNARVDWRGV